jgi:hypothetical protein
MHIAWGDLGQVFLVGLIAGAGIVALFAVGVFGLSIAAKPAAEAHVDAAGDGTGAPAQPVGGGNSAGLAIAIACFVVCAAAVVYGLYIAIPRLH